MTASELALQLRGVSAHLGGREILRDVTIDVPRGSRLGIVGVNGAGKSTLLRVMAGVLAPTAGTVSMAGADGQLHDTYRLRSRERARHLAFVPQEEGVSADLLVGEMVALGRVPMTRPWSRGGVDERNFVLQALDAVGMAHSIDVPCDQLSGGQRRRVILARGLAQQCPVMLLDEPTNHLDVAWQLRLMETVNEQAQTLVATLHDLDLALRAFDQLAVVGWPDGATAGSGPATVVAFGTPVDVLSSSHVSLHFDVGSRQIQHPELHQQHLLVHARKELS